MNKYTVVVPTRERADTLYHTLRTCIAQDYDNLEILVSDNCSTDHTVEVVNGFKDKRIRYIKTPERLSMSGNWDFALDHVSPEGYVNFIGDDDGLVPGSLHTINNILQDMPADAITSKDMAIYFWPQYVEEEIQGNLVLSIKPTYRKIDTKKYIKKSFEDLTCRHLPQLYHGYVKSELVQRLKKQHGNFFNGSSPDIYSSVVLGYVMDHHVFSDYPLTIHGLSQHSIGSSNAFKHINKNPFEKFWKENNIPFHDKLEKNSSLVIIYADAFLLAKKYVPGIPEVDIREVIRLALQEPITERNKGNRVLLIEAVERIAKKNGLEDYARQLIRKLPESYAPPPVVRYGLNPVNEMMTIKTTDIGLQNIYDAFVLCKNLLHSNPYPFFRRPPNEPLVDYFKRGILAGAKKIFR